jgi:hypothetical protein
MSRKRYEGRQQITERKHVYVISVIKVLSNVFVKERIFVPKYQILLEKNKLKIIGSYVTDIMGVYRIQRERERVLEQQNGKNSV